MKGLKKDFKNDYFEEILKEHIETRDYVADTHAKALVEHMEVQTTKQGL